MNAEMVLLFTFGIISGILLTIITMITIGRKIISISKKGGDK